MQQQHCLPWATSVGSRGFGVVDQHAEEDDRRFVACVLRDWSWHSPIYDSSCGSASGKAMTLSFACSAATPDEEMDNVNRHRRERDQWPPPLLARTLTGCRHMVFPATAAALPQTTIAAASPPPPPLTANAPSTTYGRWAPAVQTQHMRDFQERGSDGLHQEFGTFFGSRTAAGGGLVSVGRKRRFSQENKSTNLVHQLTSINRTQEHFERLYYRMKILATLHLVFCLVIFLIDIALLALLWSSVLMYEKLRLALRFLYSAYIFVIGSLSGFASEQCEEAFILLMALCILFLGVFVLQPLQMPFLQSLAEVFIEMEYTSLKSTSPEVLSLYYRTSMLSSDAGMFAVYTPKPIAIVYLRIAYCIFGILQMIITCITLTVTTRIVQTLT